MGGYRGWRVVGNSTLTSVTPDQALTYGKQLDAYDCDVKPDNPEIQDQDYPLTDNQGHLLPNPVRAPRRRRKTGAKPYPLSSDNGS